MISIQTFDITQIFVQSSDLVSATSLSLDLSRHWSIIIGHRPFGNMTLNQVTHSWKFVLAPIFVLLKVKGLTENVCVEIMSSDSIFIIFTNTDELSF